MYHPSNALKRPTPSTPQVDTEKHSGNEEELNSFSQKGPLFLLVILLLAICLVTEAQQQCHPSRRIRGRKAPPGQLWRPWCWMRVGCDAYHDYQPPRLNNVVDDSKAVWEALVFPSTTEVA
ncbi:hypothetical protein GBA52_007741 [Prunus armeniaca]|nr:hypothetical protein GBA52_007741 [Prunus armeniaca]